MTCRRNATNSAAAPAQVFVWRRDRLLAAGFAPGAAERLAQDRGIDLHAVLELIDQGCPPELAVRIRAPLDVSRRGLS